MSFFLQQKRVAELLTSAPRPIAVSFFFSQCMGWPNMTYRYWYEAVLDGLRKRFYKAQPLSSFIFCSLDI